MSAEPLALARLLTSSRSAVLSGAVLTLDGFVLSSVEVVVISEKDLMDIRALSRQGYMYAGSAGCLVGIGGR